MDLDFGDDPSSAGRRNGLPRILCLHGGGTSAMIYGFQSRMVRWALEGKFELVFADGPWRCPPGPGVVPVFEDMGPFYRWARWSRDEPEDAVRDALREVLARPGGEWVGVMGFSQGGRVAAGLLLEGQEDQDERGPGRTLADELLAPNLRFRFGIFVGASYPPMLLTRRGRERAAELGVSAAAVEDVSSTASWSTTTAAGTKVASPPHEEKLVGAIRVPSIHVLGSADEVLEYSRMLADCFERGKRRVMVVDSGHWMPRSKEDNQDLAQAVLEAYVRDDDGRRDTKKEGKKEGDE